MNDISAERKKVVVHIGPHRTGSTAIQRCLAANRTILERAGLDFVHSSTTHDAAMLLISEAFDEASAILRSIARQISASAAGVTILSQEDFAGDLPGRTRKKMIYPKLMKNLRVIQRGLEPHDVTFVFFSRDPKEWLESCYHQHLKHRVQFSNVEEFRNFFKPMESWQEKLERPKSELGESFVVYPYSREPAAGVKNLLSVAGHGALILQSSAGIENKSPAPDKLAFLERTNALSGFRETAWFSKSLILTDWTPRSPKSTKFSAPAQTDSSALIAFPELTGRAKSRISRQDAEDILPNLDVDLDDLAFRILPKEAALPEVTRANMRDQSAILDYHLRGKSELAKLNGLVISYLRRDTPHTDKARVLFHRIWNEHGVLLINELTTRWLISTLQTYLDHGANEAQRVIGASGYFIANMMKMYEGERAIEGLEQDALLRNTSPQTSGKFNGLDRFEVGGTDLLLNTNALALDLSMRDDSAGIVLQEFLLRVKHSGNIFTRMDRTRKARGINIQGFSDTWSFFSEP